MGISLASKKLAEAEFFFMLMEEHFNHYEFAYFLSAFLSALCSSIEHNRLQSRDSRFKKWYDSVKTQRTDLSLLRLSDFRNKEIHHKGVDSWQRIGMSFPEGIEATTPIELEFDLRSGTPVGRYKTGGMIDFMPQAVQNRWVWDVVGEPDVMELCSKGLQIVRTIIAGRDAMGFPD